jgi:hypothetical protein
MPKLNINNVILNTPSSLTIVTLKSSDTISTNQIQLELNHYQVHVMQNTR